MGRGARHCPRPEKSPFSSWFLADRAADTLKHDKGLVMYPYRCDCGRWHLTSSEPYRDLSRHGGH